MSDDPFLKNIKQILSDKDNKKGTLVRICQRAEHYQDFDEILDKRF